MRSIFLCLAFAMTAFAPLGSALTVAAKETTTQDAGDPAVFDEVWTLVRDKFYDRDLKGLDWNAIGNKYRPRFVTASGDVERSAVINAMLDELGVSHTRHYTDEQTAYYELVDIFSYPLRGDIRRRFSGGTVTYSGIGIFAKRIDGKTFVSGVMAGHPAEKAGLRQGDEIVAADGEPFEPVGSFRDKEGEVVDLQIRRMHDGPLQTIAVKPQRIVPDEAFEKALRNSARIIEANGKRIGYVHVPSYAGSRFQGALEELLSDGKLKDADAFIWDLRDGWGGASPEYLNIFDPHGPTMHMIDRNGDAEVFSFRWRKPVALLINGGTRSGKEVLTYGFKKNGYGPVIGERTAGALLAGRAFMLSDGSLLILAVNDVTIDGERLEGNGVTPTIKVPFDIRYAAGKDPQLDKAIEVLSEGV